MNKVEMDMAIDMGAHAAQESLGKVRDIVDTIPYGSHVKGAAYLIGLASLKGLIDAFMLSNPGAMDETMRRAFEDVYLTTRDKTAEAYRKRQTQAN